MALDEPTLIGEVRGLTDYPPEVLSDSVISGLVETARKDIISETENPELDFYDMEDMDANRALMWLTCLFCKIKAGEIDGVDFSLAEIDVESLRAAGKERGERPVFWYAQVQKFLGQLESNVDQNGKAFGHANIARDTRTYTTGGENTE